MAIILLFGIFDSMQIIPWQQSQVWDQYNLHVMPAIMLMWAIALGAVAFMYYLLKKDKSEAVGIFIAGELMLLGGVEDISFFVLGNNVMTSQMCWFTGTQTIISTFLGEACVSPLSLWLNAILSLFIAWNVLKWFFKQRW